MGNDVLPVTVDKLDAFVVGWSPPVAGLYFNGLALLAIADRGAEVAFARLVGEERDRVVGYRDASFARLAQTEATLGRLGAAVPPRPNGPEEFEAWAEAVFAAAAEVMEDGSPAAVTHLAGFVLGEAVATLTVMASLSRLRHMSPDDLWMRAQASSLEREREQGERRLARLATHEHLPGPVQVALAAAGHAVAQAGPSVPDNPRQANLSAGEVTAAAAEVEGLLSTA
jgi:hypothetical protein